MAGRPLTAEERKAAEAAFKGCECEPAWSASAHRIYDGIIRAVVSRALREAGLPREPLKPEVPAVRGRRSHQLIRRRTN